MSGGVRQDAADTKSVPVDEDETPTTAAEIRALAEQAEAEAAEAEALAGAARARARVIKLRREAELAKAKKQPAVERVSEDDEADPADSVQTAHDASSEVEPEGAESADEPENAENEQIPDGSHAEPDVDTSSADDATEKPGRRRLRLPGRPRRPRWSTVAAAQAITIAVAALSGSLYMVKEHRDVVRQRQRVAEFAAAARQGVVALTSADFNNVRQSVQRVVDDSTGSFKDDFLKTADDFVKVVEEEKIVEKGTVQATGVDRDTLTDDSAVVLVACTSEVTDAAGVKQDPRSYRLIVTVTREGDRLKMSKVEFVP